MQDDEIARMEEQNSKLVRLGEILTLIIVVLVVASIFVGLDARSMADRNFENIKFVKNMQMFYYLVGVFPLMYLYVEDRRIEKQYKASKRWYWIMAIASLVIWTAIGWVVAFKF